MTGLARRCRALGVALGLALSAPGAAAAVPALPAAQQQAAEAPRVMVMLDLPPAHLRAGGSYGAYGDDAGRQMRLRLARRIAGEHRLTLVEDWPMELIGVDCVIMRIDDGRSPDAVVRELSGVHGVAWSQPLNTFELQGAAAPRYNDRLLAAQPADARWHLARLHRVATGRGVTIGIVDSRIDTAHPDLAGQIAGSSDFVPGRPQPERHGTGVAGIIAARPNNAMGIVGIAPGARVLGLRACWERAQDGRTVCDSLSLAKALTFAIESHVDVINLSLAGPPDPLLTRLIALALARGATVVAAIDPHRPATSFPASLSGVVAVGDERLSALRDSVYIAPGVDVPTTEPEGKWGLVSGSSYAAAHVSGLAALLRQGGATRRPADSLLGPHGTIDACALVAQRFHLQDRGC
ncbi:MAG: S8 family serine peptidase [Sphingomonadales bacterium]|nr:S8 family serine peptidase [Sphingomonadales bacterium]